MALCYQACYAMGYNLAIEYLADYEKTWMLDSFRAFNSRVLVQQGRPLSEWLFLEVCPLPLDTPIPCPDDGCSRANHVPHSLACAKLAIAFSPCKKAETFMWRIAQYP